LSNEESRAVRVPFGKYKGSLVSELPSDYLAWLAGLADLREPFKSSVEEERHRRGTRYDYSHAPDFRLHGPDRQVAKRIVEAGRRTLAKAEHPDHGGDAAAMTRVNAVADLLLEAVG
jgi:hypothetical protein